MYCVHPYSILCQQNPCECYTLGLLPGSKFGLISKMEGMKQDVFICIQTGFILGETFNQSSVRYF